MAKCNSQWLISLMNQVMAVSFISAQQTRCTTCSTS